MKKDPMKTIEAQLKAQSAICSETFKRIEQALKYISENIEEHKKGSEERHIQIQKLITDMEVVKTNLSNHLQHHTEIRQEFQWRTGLIVGIVTFIVSIAINLIMKHFGG